MMPSMTLAAPDTKLEIASHTAAAMARHPFQTPAKKAPNAETMFMMTDTTVVATAMMAFQTAVAIAPIPFQTPVKKAARAENRLIQKATMLFQIAMIAARNCSFVFQK